MKKLAVMALALAMFATAAVARPVDFDPSKVLVRTRADVSVADLADAIAEQGLMVESVTTQSGLRADALTFARTEGVFAPPAFISVAVPAGADVDAVIAQLSQIDGVKSVSKNIILKAFWTPNDYNASDQWNFAKIGMPQAWDITKGSTSVKVAVVDTGLYTYDDNPVNLAPGHNMVDNNDDVTDKNGHGTHVAGTIAQATNNGTGVAGMAPNVTLFAVKVLGDNGQGTLEQVAGGIRWAADNGADVMNMSLGCEADSEGCDDPTMRDAVQYAASKGVVIAAASGNSSKSVVGFPAAYEECIAVGATDSSDKIASFSNQGSALDISAPGVGIKQQTHWGIGFGFPMVGTPSIESLSGTSMASPHVAGLAAMILSAASSTVDVRDVIQSTADDLGSAGWDATFGWGRINAARALQSLR